MNPCPVAEPAQGRQRFNPRDIRNESRGPMQCEGRASGPARFATRPSGIALNRALTLNIGSNRRFLPPGKLAKTLNRRFGVREISQTRLYIEQSGEILFGRIGRKSCLGQFPILM